MSEEITYRQEKWQDCSEEVFALTALHFDECDISGGRHKFSPNRDEFNDLASVNLLHLTTARVGDKLVGYLVNMLGRNMLYAAPCSYHIGWYILPEHRGRAGIEILKASEDYLRAIGVERMHGAHTMAVDAQKVFERLGWELSEKHYTKWND